MQPLYQFNLSTANLSKVEAPPAITIKHFNASNSMINPMVYQPLASQTQIMQPQPSPEDLHQSGSTPPPQKMCSQN